MTTPSLERDSKNLRSEAQARAERSVREGLVEKLMIGDLAEVEFTELALDAGMSLKAIARHISRARAQDDEL